MPRKLSKLLPYKELSNHFYYDLDSGALYRISASGGYGINRIVGTKNSHGHLVCRFNRKIYYVHRLIWKLYYKAEPPAIIDHINGDGADNRITNLRAASDAQNNANSNVRKHNKYGVKGVHWSSQERKWRSSIKVDRKTIHLGWFKNPEDAEEAYREASLRYYGEYSIFAL